MLKVARAVPLICAACASYAGRSRQRCCTIQRPRAAPADRRRIAARRARPRLTGAALLKGFALGTVLSAAAAASIAVVVLRGEQDERLFGDAISAHLRSLQADHLSDVLSTDQHTVKPWFNGNSTCRRRLSI